MFQTPEPTLGKGEEERSLGSVGDGLGVEVRVHKCVTLHEFTKPDPTIGTSLSQGRTYFTFVPIHRCVPIYFSDTFRGRVLTVNCLRFINSSSVDTRQHKIRNPITFFLSFLEQEYFEGRMNIFRLFIHLFISGIHYYS